MEPSDVERLAQAACHFQGLSKRARALCREQYRREEKIEDLSIRILIDGQIADLADRVTEKIPKTSAEISYQLIASASFIRTHFIITDLVLDGDLVEAATLTRKQLEAVSRLFEIDSIPLEKLLGKTPNIGLVLKQGTGRIYGLLSEIAHSATPDIADYLQIMERGGQIGPSLHPLFSARSRLCSDINSFLALLFLAWFVQKLPIWYPGYDNSSDVKALAHTFSLARDVDLIRLAT